MHLELVNPDGIAGKQQHPRGVTSFSGFMTLKQDIGS